MYTLCMHMCVCERKFVGMHVCLFVYLCILVCASAFILVVLASKVVGAKASLKRQPLDQCLCV